MATGQDLEPEPSIEIELLKSSKGLKLYLGQWKIAGESGGGPTVQSVVKWRVPISKLKAAIGNELFSQMEEEAKRLLDLEMLRRGPL